MPSVNLGPHTHTQLTALPLFLPGLELAWLWHHLLLPAGLL